MMGKFKILGGDLDKNSVFSSGKLISRRERILLSGNIESLELLPSANRNSIIMEVMLKDGRNFIAETDPKTYSQFEDFKLERGWEGNQEPKAKAGLFKRIVTGIATVFLGLVIIGMFSDRPAIRQEAEQGPTEKASGLIEGVNKAQEKDITAFLKTLDIEPAGSIQHDPLLDNATGAAEIGYRITTADVKGVILYLAPNKTVYKIKYAGNPLYDNGKTIAKLSDYVLSIEEFSDHQIQTKKMVEAVLKAPATAKFPGMDDWARKKTPEGVELSSYVDAQNSFGANIRAKFYVKFNKSGTPVKFMFDGEKII